MWYAALGMHSSVGTVALGVCHNLDAHGNTALVNISAQIVFVHVGNYFLRIYSLK